MKPNIYYNSLALIPTGATLHLGRFMIRNRFCALFYEHMIFGFVLLWATPGQAQSPRRVWNLEVGGHHTIAIGNRNVQAHNASDTYLQEAYLRERSALWQATHKRYYVEDSQHSFNRDPDNPSRRKNHVYEDTYLGDKLSVLSLTDFLDAQQVQRIPGTAETLVPLYTSWAKKMPDRARRISAMLENTPLVERQQQNVLETEFGTDGQRTMYFSTDRLNEDLPLANFLSLSHEAAKQDYRATHEDLSEMEAHTLLYGQLLPYAEFLLYGADEDLLLQHLHSTRDIDPDQIKPYIPDSLMPFYPDAFEEVVLQLSGRHPISEQRLLEVLQQERPIRVVTQVNGHDTAVAPRPVPERRHSGMAVLTKGEGGETGGFKKWLDWIMHMATGNN